MLYNCSTQQQIAHPKSNIGTPRQKYHTSNNYFYYNTLAKIKDKYQLINNDLSNFLFKPRSTEKKFIVVAPPDFQERDHSYNIQKINNKMFKIHRTSFTTQKKSQSLKRPQTQALHLNLQFTQQKKIQSRPKLQQIVNKHRMLQKNYKLRQIESNRQKTNISQANRDKAFSRTRFKFY